MLGFWIYFLLHFALSFSGADVLKQLAKMRQQLRSEKERVETDLTREKVCQ